MSSQLLVLAFALVIAAAVPAAAQTPAAATTAPLWGVGFDDTLARPGGLAGVLARPPGPPDKQWTHPIHVRLIVTRAELEREFSALDARLAAYRAVPGIDVYLDIRGQAPSPAELPAWTAFLRALVARTRATVRGYIVGVEDAAAPRAPAAAYAFFLKTTAVELRATHADALVVLGGVGDADAAWLDALYDEDVAPYLDAVGLAADRPADRIPAIVQRRDGSAATVVLGAPLGDAVGAAGERLATHRLDLLGTPVTGATYVGATPIIEAALPTIAALRDLIDQPLEALDDATSSLSLTRVAGAAGAGPVRHRLLFGVNSISTYLVYASGGASLNLTVMEPTGTHPVVRDPVTQARTPAEGFAYDKLTRLATLRLPGSSRPLVVDWSLGDTMKVDRSDVSTSVLPSIAEIIARHQQAQAAQDAVISTLIANAKMTQHFRPNVADPGYDVVTENRFFTQGKQTEFEELDFRFMGTRWGSDRPPFPLLQAEKVLSLPFDLRLTADYRYALDGVADVDGRECFVVRVDPIRAGQSLYRGTVWIDRQTYLKAKVHTIQTELEAPVLTSEETHHFGRVGDVAGRDVYLLVELVGRQNILLAGRSLLVERRLAFRDFQLNPSDFEAQRQAARSSDRIMFRDTDKGLRPLVRQGSERVVDDRITKSAKALLLGVNVDPSYDFPLPLGGLNYLDFDFLGPDSQLAVVFAGVLALVNVQRPKLIGDSVDGSVDLFAIAVPGSDRTYDAQGERPDERVNTIPFTTGANLGWRLGERLRLLGNYQFRYDWYFNDTTTAPGYQLPSSTATNGIGLGVEWRRAGYAFSANWTGYARATWNPWGLPGDYDPSHKEYSRHSAALTKDFFSGVHKVHLNAAYYGGQRLDRFSQYQFGFFDEHRIHGVPASGVRFSDLGMFRASYAFNLFEQYRAEIALDHAYGRDPRMSRDWQRITGIGVGFLFRAPFGTMIRGDVGKSFLPSQYSKPGSLVFQIQILKPLGR